MYTVDEIKNNVIIGNCLEELKKFPNESVNMCCSSPPYWGLRDYGTPPAIFGGDDSCDHDFGDTNVKDMKQKMKDVNNWTCSKCGAWKGQFGLEPTPEMYVRNSVLIFREIRRILKDDGTFWLNLGDSYAGSGGINGVPDDWASISTSNRKKHSKNNPNKKTKEIGLKPKDLIGIPWQVAFALREDGWYFRTDIVWSKNNPMPESVTDRPTRSHEFIFLFSKSQKYYYDYKAIREKSDTIWNNRNWDTSYSETMSNQNRTYGAGSKHDANNHSWRNKRTVWTVNTKPFKEAHFAVFPPELIQPCIIAGCPEGGIVMDPFMGSGTTAMVALQSKRNYTGTELNEEYLNIQKKRIDTVDVDKVMGNNRLSELFVDE